MLLDYFLCSSDDPTAISGNDKLKLREFHVLISI